MNKTTQIRLQVLLIISALALLVLALALNRWYACLPLVGLLAWLIPQETQV